MSSEGKAAALTLLYLSRRPAHAAGGSADSTRMMSSWILPRSAALKDASIRAS
jgi:hypothetical protein